MRNSRTLEHFCTLTWEKRCSRRTNVRNTFKIFKISKFSIDIFFYMWKNYTSRKEAFYMSNLFKELIQERGDTQEALSIAVKIPSGRLSEKINGKRPFSIDELNRIRIHYSLSLGDIERLFLGGLPK